jgi:hypothetical protein
VATEATFRFAPTADPLGFDCSLDGARFAPCRSPATFRRLRPGPHVFRVRAVDATAVGRPSAFRWEVLPPPPVPLPDLVISTYTGTTVVVRNVGDGPAGASTLFLGSAGYFPVPALPVNGQRTIQHLPCPAGASSAVVDVANQVVEQDEGNNLAVGGPFACVPPVRIPTSPPASPSTPASASASASAPASTPPTSAPPTTSATSNAPPSTKAPTRPPTTGASPPPSTQRLTVRVRDGGFGSVNGPKIQCGSICAADVPQGTQVVLTANPTDTGRFVRWGGDCSGTSGTTCVLTMSSSRTVRAAFGPARAPLAVRVSGRKFGAVTGPGIQCGSACAAAYRQGSVVTLFADPAGSGRFLGWGGDCAGSKGDTCQLVMDSAKQVSASFAPAVAHLRVVVRGSDKGTVTGPKIQWGKACLAANLQGTAVTPIAAPVAGAVFKGWAGACQGCRPRAR